jgi:hypothetical protein
MIQVLAVSSEADIDRIVPELRAALEEHIRLAKESLVAQATALERPLQGPIQKRVSKQVTTSR